MYPLCQQEIEHLTEQATNFYFGDTPLRSMTGIESGCIDSDVEDTLDSEQLTMLKAITKTVADNDEIQQNIALVEDKEIEVSGVKFTIPRALITVEIRPFQGVGKLSRSRLSVEDGNLRTSILHIEKGGCVPTHTHKGFEVTLLLQGGFEDGWGRTMQGILFG